MTAFARTVYVNEIKENKLGGVWDKSIEAGCVAHMLNKDECKSEKRKENSQSNYRYRKDKTRMNRSNYAGQDASNLGRTEIQIRIKKRRALESSWINSLVQAKKKEVEFV